MKEVIAVVNDFFNSRSQLEKKVMLLIFGVTVGGLSFMLIIQAFYKREGTKKLETQEIQTPSDIYMRDEKTFSEDELIPIGKLKGEIGGEFEAFYLAVDLNGKTYINRSPEFSRDAYHKSKGWEEISRTDLERYQRELHFLPARSKGVKH